MLHQLSSKYIIIIYKNACNGVDLKKIQRQIFQETINFTKIHKFQPTKMNNYAQLVAKRVVKARDDALGLGLVELSLFDAIFKELSLNENTDLIEKPIYEYANKVEKEEKEQAIKTTLNENRFNHKVFYLCSEHGDCAKDHLNYQGKIYIDEKWRDIVGRDTEEYDAIMHYVRINQIKTFQWVIGKPVWMITRPNCRHYFVGLQTKSVLNNSVEELLNQRKMTTKVGLRRKLQTIKHPTDKQRYSLENINNIILKYQQRLDLYNKLYKIKRTDKLHQAIRKTRLLISKRKNYKKSHF